MDTAGSNKTSAGDSECCSASRYVEATAMTHARWSAYDMGVGAASAREQSTVPLGPPPLPLASTAAPVRTVANSVAITEVVIRGEIERMCASFAGLSHRFDENAATPAGRAGPRGPGVEGSPALPVNEPAEEVVARKARLPGTLAVTVLLAGGTHASRGASTAATRGAPKPGARRPARPK